MNIPNDKKQYPYRNEKMRKAIIVFKQQMIKYQKDLSDMPRLARFLLDRVAILQKVIDSLSLYEVTDSYSLKTFEEYLMEQLIEYSDDAFETPEMLEKINEYRELFVISVENRTEEQADRLKFLAKKISGTKEYRNSLLIEELN